MTDTELTLEELANMLASGLPNLDEAGFIKLVAAARKHIEATGAERSRAHVVKTGGDYSFEGVVVARFHKLSGKERVVVENSDGILHIFNPTQLSPSKQEVAGASEGKKFQAKEVGMTLDADKCSSCGAVLAYCRCSVVSFAKTPGDPIQTVLRRYDVKNAEVLTGSILDGIMRSGWRFGTARDVARERDDAFQRGLEAGAEYLNTLAGMPVGDATSALYRNLANEIRAL